MIKRPSMHQEDQDTRRQWREYEKRNRRANAAYGKDSPSIDHRYDPTGSPSREDREQIG